MKSPLPNYELFSFFLRDKLFIRKTSTLLLKVILSVKAFHAVNVLAIITGDMSRKKLLFRFRKMLFNSNILHINQFRLKCEYLYRR